MALPTTEQAEQKNPEASKPRQEDGDNLMVWVWSDGALGGPFPFSDIIDAQAEVRQIPGVLFRLSGGEWMPWEDLERAVVARVSKARRIDPKADTRSPDYTLRAIAVATPIALLGLWAFWKADIAVPLLLAPMVALGALFVYLAPIMVARNRRHHQALAITVLTVFAGWTFIGWIIALVWACTATSGESRKGF